MREYIKDGYIVREYDNGTVEKILEGYEITEPIIYEEQISEQDQIQAEMLLNQCSILIIQENQDAVLAEILINQLGV